MTLGPLIETGGYALGMFFALSGYLIARPFVFAFVHGQRLPRIWSYARNRILRIVPAFWAVLTVLLLIYGTKGATAGEVVSVYGFWEFANADVLPTPHRPGLEHQGGGSVLRARPGDSISADLGDNHRFVLGREPEPRSSWRCHSLLPGR